MDRFEQFGTQFEPAQPALLLNFAKGARRNFLTLFEFALGEVPTAQSVDP